MKKVIAVMALVLPLLALSLIDKLDEDNGFANYKFGSSPTAYKDLTLEIDDGKTQLYSSEDKTINVNGVQVNHVRLTFCKNHLSAIAIQTKQSTGNKLFVFLKEKYGEPKKVKENHEWLSKKVQLLYEPIDKDAEISFFSKEIYDHKQAKN